MVYDSLEPIGARRADLHAASICSTIANMTAISNRSKTRFNLSDFLLKFGDDMPTTEQRAAIAADVNKGETKRMKGIAQMWFALHQADHEKRQKAKAGRK